MAKIDDPVIVRTPGLMSGDPCFRGTRVRGEQLLLELADHPEMIREAFTDHFPSVTVEDAQLMLQQAATLVLKHAPLVPPDLMSVREDLARKGKEITAIGLKSIRCFGSVVRGKATWGSDIDLLLTPAAQEGTSLLDLVTWEDGLGQILGGYKVDAAIDRGIETFKTERIGKRAMAEAVVVWSSAMNQDEIDMLLHGHVEPIIHLTDEERARKSDITDGIRVIGSKEGSK